MICEDYMENLSAYSDGELTGPEKAAFEKHLEICDQCRDELERIRSLKKTISEMPRMKAPSDFSAGVMKKIQAKIDASSAKPTGHAPEKRHSLGSFFFATAALVMIALTLIFTLKQGEDLVEVAVRQEHESTSIGEESGGIDPTPVTLSKRHDDIPIESTHSNGRKSTANTEADGPVPPSFGKLKEAGRTEHKDGSWGAPAEARTAPPSFGMNSESGGSALEDESLRKKESDKFGASEERVGESLIVHAKDLREAQRLIEKNVGAENIELSSELDESSEELVLFALLTRKELNDLNAMLDTVWQSMGKASQGSGAGARIEREQSEDSAEKESDLSEKEEKSSAPRPEASRDKADKGDLNNDLGETGEKPSEERIRILIRVLKK